MIKSNVIARLGLAAMLFTAPAAIAQDIHFSQFDMQPLVVNPAFTGMFYGKVRANAIYRTQWASVTVPYKTYGASIDMPIKSESDGDYLAGGLQVYKDQAGDGNLSNFTGMVSLAYHKTFGGDNGSDYSGSDLAVGFQAGYAQKSIDLSKLFFGDELQGGTFVGGTSQEYSLGMNNSRNYYLVNAGISYAKAVNENFNFVIGLAGNNLNQPNDGVLKKQNSQTGLDMRYTGLLGMVWHIGDRFSLRPAALFQSQASATEIIAGNEFHYSLASRFGEVQFTPGVFAGVWYRSGDATMVTAGIDIKNCRISMAYDYNVSTLNNASNGNGGFEIAFRYIAPYIVDRRRTIPCARF